MQKCVTICSIIRTTQIWQYFTDENWKNITILYAHICKNLSIQTGIDHTSAKIY